MESECITIRKNILRIAHSSNHGHIPTCFSVVEILYALYHYMRHDPQQPNWPERDIFILSKGHASLALYAMLAQIGYFSIDEVFSLGAFNSNFGCHADRLKIPGIEASTGSLGHGIGLAVGMALAIRMHHENRQVYTLIGDGESNEGTVWEALLVADSLQLDNLTIIYDDNRSHSRGLQVRAPKQKFEAFGCHVLEVDGHDVQVLKTAFAVQTKGPKAIVARTVKGHGCPLLSENQYEWHRKSPNAEQLDMLMEQLDAQAI